MWERDAIVMSWRWGVGWVDGEIGARLKASPLVIPSKQGRREGRREDNQSISFGFFPLPQLEKQIH
jgi:hypothetical protein